jgi:hypothetical protein
MLNKICAMTAKTTPWPLLHRDHFLAKETDPAGAASANTTYLYCRAVSVHCQHFITLLQTKKSVFKMKK